MELIDRTATQIVHALAQGQARSADLAERWIARHEASAALNCWVDFDAEGLRRQAAAVDQRHARGERLPLLGVAVALKDNIDALGFACGAGTAALHGRRPRADAELVRRLRAAGALIAGKVGMHELALGVTNNNAVTGAVRNPWDPARVPGGSSGGSGAVVAARLVPVSIGTDTGGSVRVPAALCGVAGLRPTVGRVSGQGLVPIARTRDTAGPLARSVADLALFDGVLSGDTAPLPPVALRGLRLGLPQPHFWDELDAGVRTQAERALQALRDAGVDCVPVDLPGLAALSEELGFVIALHEFTRDLGHYLQEQDCGVGLAEVVQAIRSPDVAAIAGPLLGAGAVPAAAYQEALAARQRLRAQYAQALTGHGVAALLFPTTPVTAPRIGEDDFFTLNGRPCPTFATLIRNTDPGSNAGLPGLSLPIGLAHGLPVGLALDGAPGSDRTLLAIGAALEAALPPMPAPASASASASASAPAP